MAQATNRKLSISSQCEHKFCPSGGLLPDQNLSDTMAEMVLRPVLRVFAPAFLVAGIVLMLIEQTPQVPVWTLGVQFGLLALLAAASAVALLSKEIPLRKLRVIEASVFGPAALFAAFHGYAVACQTAMAGRPELTHSAFLKSIVQVLLVIVAYGTFVPNNWRRALGTAGLIAAAPLVMGLLLPMILPAGVGRTVSGLPLGEAAVALAAGALLAVAGAYMVNRYQTATAEAMDMGFYRLKRKIGSGGMGEVWLAEHQLLARPAAIKMIRTDILENGDGESGERSLARFEREARATASLRSPHTVELYDFGSTIDGTFYYVMEYLDGFDFDTLVNRFGPLPPERVVRLLRQACDSLADAHSNGLVHRDIKPANLIACRLGMNFDFVKVLDFGLVKDNGSSANKQLTMDGTTTGTPAFMAPEMAVNQHEVDLRTDIYALGCVGYWLLTGHLVFDHENPLAVVVDHVKTEPIPPSGRTEIAVPEDLDKVILNCLRKRPEERFQSAVELSDALAACRLEQDWDDLRARSWWELHQPHSGRHAA